MKFNHRIGSVVFGVIVGLVAAAWSYQWVTDPQKLAARKAEERAVLHARDLLAERLSIANLEVVDPLAADRKVGKVYIYPTNDGWDISGYYRRDEDDSWHAFLMSVSSGLQLQALKVDDDDPALAARAQGDPDFEVTR